MPKYIGFYNQTQAFRGGNNPMAFGVRWNGGVRGDPNFTIDTDQLGTIDLTKAQVPEGADCWCFVYDARPGTNWSSESADNFIYNSNENSSAIYTYNGQFSMEIKNLDAENSLPQNFIEVPLDDGV